MPAADQVSTKLLEGALAGLIATVPMTLFMLAAHRNLPLPQRYPLPPSLITQRTLGRRPTSAYLPMPNLAATLLLHFAFGAATGAVFSAAPAAMRQAYPAATGIAYGLSVWAASYLGWVPASKLMPPATRQPPARNAMMVAAHVVWGATLGYAFNVLSTARNESPLP